MFVFYKKSKKFQEKKVYAANNLRGRKRESKTEPINSSREYSHCLSLCANNCALTKYISFFF